MRIEKTNLLGVLIVDPEVYKDHRGEFREIHNLSRYADAGISTDFKQDNFSRSKKGVLRGLHFQKTKPQGKLVTCLNGSVFDVVADINPRSSTFRQVFTITLSGDNNLQLWIPPGYAHGFFVTSGEADFYYKCTSYYDPADESGVIWNDPDLNIDWPCTAPILSEKDGDLPTLKKLCQQQ